MLQEEQTSRESLTLWQAILSAWRRSDLYRSYLLRLLYAALLGVTLLFVLEARPPLANAPAVAWALGLGTVALLKPDAARWMLAILIASSLAATSLALAALVIGATVLAILLAPESPLHAVPVRFALLVATPLAALQDLALLPFAIGVAIAGETAWWTGLLQALFLIGYAAATGALLPGVGLPASIPSLISIGGPVAVGDWWNHFDSVWERAITPWAVAMLSEPTNYLRLIALWAFAGLVGGRVVAACQNPLLRLASTCVAPVLAAIGLAIFQGAAAEPTLVATAVGAGFMAFCVAAFIQPATVEEPYQYSAEVVPQVSGPPAVVEPPMRAATWSEIAGYDDVKREVREALEPLVDPRLRAALARAGIEPSRGVLLYGPPGTGKTLLARAAASELQLGFVLVAGPEVLNKYVGESEAALRQAFTKARLAAPAILFFDEIEALVPPRRGEVDGMSGVHRTLVATLLGLMDGARELGNIVVMAATNAPNQVDPALLRPGRFERVIYMPAPDPETRRLILKKHLEGKPGAESIEVKALVKLTERFTGADLAGAIRRAYEASRGEPITTEQLLSLARATRPTLTLAMLDQYKALSERFGRTSQTMKRMEAAPRPKLTWDDVGGLDEAKQALREAVMLPLEYPDLVAKFGVRPSRGILLHGPPGTGKTLLARVVADQARATFLSAGGSELSGPGGPDAIRRLFSRAREAAPAVIFIDEIDAIGSRGLAAFGATAVHQLLVEMDGVRPSEGLVVMAATNRLEDLDGALLRPGRFDTAVLVGLPDLEARRAIFALHLRGKPGADAVDINRLAEQSVGRSPAEIAAAVNAAARQLAMQAAQTGGALGEKRGLTTENILEQLKGS